MPGLIRKIADCLNNLKTRRKLLMMYCLTGILPMLCLGGLLINNTGNLVMQQRRSQTEAENKRVKIVIFDATYLASNISQIIFFDNQLKAMITKKYAGPSEVYEAYRSYSVLDTYMSNYTEISGISVYVDNETMIPYGHFKMITADVKKAEWFQKAAKSSGEIVWTVDSAMSKDGYLFLVRKIPVNYSGGFAVLVISISNNFLKLMINDSNLHSVVALDYGKIFYSDNGAEVCQPLDIDVERENPQIPKTGEAEYGGGKALLSSSVLDPVNADDGIQIITIDQSAIKNTNEVTVSISILVAISLLIPYAIILFFSNNYSRRIITLRREMHKVAGGDFNVIDSFKGKDELSDVYDDMKTMIDCIQNLYKEIYNEKLTKEKLSTRQHRMELELLMSQINPHFLFNTLETIRMQALVDGNREVAHITKLLGKSIRHVLEVGHAPVPLASELEYIRIYMDIQIFRFSKISYTIHIADDVNAAEYEILPLLLQPVVENSIVHGLEGKGGGGWIRLEIGRAEGFLVITITDNGTGMSEVQCRALQEKIQGGETAQARVSIGLTNVQQRIKLFYGPEYGMKIKSGQDEGTTVTMYLPAECRGAANNENPDR